jgi:transposase
MAEAYPFELRVRAVRAYESGVGSLQEVAGAFAIGTASLKRWLRQSRRTGDLSSTRKGGGNRSQIVLSEVEALLRALGDANAGELTAQFNKGRRGRSRVHVSSMKRALHRFGYVVKKNAAGRWRLSDPTSS